MPMRSLRMRLLLKEIFDAKRIYYNNPKAKTDFSVEETFYTIMVTH